jgi:hypothetical protein
MVGATKASPDHAAPFPDGLLAPVHIPIFQGSGLLMHGVLHEEQCAGWRIGRCRLNVAGAAAFLAEMPAHSCINSKAQINLMPGTVAHGQFTQADYYGRHSRQ